MSVHDEVFGEDHSALGKTLLAGPARQHRTAVAVVAFAGSTPIAAGRVEFHAGTDFASLWGGGTLPAWRGRGVFRSLVAYRAALASARGFRYLQVDASPDSRPILQRLGFVELATTTPFMHPGGTGSTSHCSPIPNDSDTPLYRVPCHAAVPRWALRRAEPLSLSPARTASASCRGVALI